MNLKCNVNLNRIPSNYNILQDFETARLYHLKHGVSWTFTFKNVDVKGYTSKSVILPLSGQRYILDGAENLVQLDYTSDVDIFVFDQAEWSSPTGSQFPLLPNTPTGDCFLNGTRPFINIGTYLFDHNDGQTAIQIAHELMHALVKIAYLKGYNIEDKMDTYYLNNLQDLANSNFMQEWELLNPFLNTQTYKYFKPSEIVELKPELVQLLDQARGIAGIPFKITSGLRNSAQNQAVGGKPNSAHLSGEAVDLACYSPSQRWLMLNALLKVGFNRLEIAKLHIHADISKTLPQNIIDFSSDN